MEKKRVFSVSIVLAILIFLSGCAGFGSKVKSFQHDVVGVGFNVQFYDNSGDRILTVDGEKISVNTNFNEVLSVDSDGNKTHSYENSSVITITCDGKEILQTGNTVIFAEHGLEPLLDFNLPEEIQSSDQGGDGYIAVIDRFINKYKNYFGKPKVVVISSQLGVPIVAYGGSDVYYEIPDDLPKTTILHIDGKALYIHRANFIICDTELIQ